jgi:hypothetical protein
MRASKRSNSKAESARRGAAGGRPEFMFAMFTIRNNTELCVQAALMKQGADVAHAIDRRVSSELEYDAHCTLHAHRAVHF